MTQYPTQLHSTQPYSWLKFLMDRGQWITRSNMLVDRRVTLEPLHGPLELFVGKCGAHHIDKRADVEGQSGEVALAPRMKLEKTITGPTMFSSRCDNWTERRNKKPRRRQTKEHLAIPAAY